MHRLFILQLFFLWIALPARGQRKLIDSMINSDDARMLVEHLASDSLKGRFSGTREAASAGDFIAREFQHAGTKSISGNKGYLCRSI